MGSALPTLLVVGVMALAGFVLINPELRCSVMNLCGNTSRQPEEDEEDPPAAAQPAEPEGPDVINNYYPAPIVNTPPPVVVRPIIYGGRDSAVHDCCDCKTQWDGTVKCRTGNRGPYTIGYASARYDAVKAARMCSERHCYHRPPPRPYPQPSPPSCPTRVTKYGRTYYITNLTKLPIQTMIHPPNYIQSGRCIYQLIQDNTPNPPPNPPPGNQNPPPPPPPNTTNCNNHLCKNYPWLCPKCIKPTPAASSGYVRSLFAATRVSI